MGFFKRKSTKSNSNNEIISSNVINISDSHAGSKKEKVFLDADTILNRPTIKKRVFQIREISAVNNKFFNEYYLPVIKNLAVRFQDAPASKNHHHSHDFGLIEHSLEVALFSMRYSLSTNYFPDGDEEKIQLLQYAFTYCVFIGAMLHDSAKIITDYSFKIQNNGEWIHWSALYADIPSQKEEVPYRLFRNQNDDGIKYKKTSHEIAATMLFTEVVPLVGLKWLHEFSKMYADSMFIDLIHTIGSDYDNGSSIGAAVKFGDMESTKRSLKASGLAANMVTQDSLNKSTPLHEAYLIALSDLVSNYRSNGLNINGRHKGANSHIERFGNLFFLSSKVLMAKATRWLQEQGVTVPTADKAPQVLCDNGIALTTPAGDTLWWVTFFKAEDDTSKTKDLAYIVIPADKLNVHDFPMLDYEEVIPFFSSRVTGLDSSAPLSESTNKSIYDLLYVHEPVTPEKKTAEPITNEEFKGADSNASSVSHVDVPNTQESDEANTQIGASSSSNSGKASSPKRNDNQGSALHAPERFTEQSADNEPEINEFEIDQATIETQVEDDEDNELTYTIFGSFSNSSKPTSSKSALPERKPDVATDLSEETQDDGYEEVDLTVKQMQLLHRVNTKVPPWLQIKNTGRNKRANIYDKACLENLFPSIQQMINTKQITFNKKDSPVHYVAEGVFLVSPQFFVGMSQKVKSQRMLEIKRSQFVYFHGEKTIVTMDCRTDNMIKGTSGTHKVNGFLLNYHELIYNGEKLKPSEWLSLQNPEDAKLIERSDGPKPPATTKSKIKKPLTKFVFQK